MEKALKLESPGKKPKIINNCTICNAPATQACSICLTDYCSEKCQMKDWDLHQRLCDDLAKELLMKNPTLSQKQQKVEVPMNNVNVNHNGNVNHNVNGNHNVNVKPSFVNSRDPRLRRKSQTSSQVASPNVPQPIPPCILQQMPSNNPQQIPQRMPPNIPQQMPQKILSNIPQQMPQKIPSGIPQQMPKKPPLGVPPQMPSNIPPQIPSKNPQKGPPPPHLIPNLPKKVKKEPPSNFQPQTDRPFPPPLLEIPENPCIYNKQRTLPIFNNIDDENRRLDPRLNRSPREPVQNITREIDCQRNLEPEKLPNKIEIDNELFTRRPVAKPAVFEYENLSQDSQMDIETMRRSNTTAPQNEVPKIRIKSLNLLMEKPPPKPPTEKISTKLINNLDEGFASIFGPAIDEPKENVPDIPHLGDLDDIEMDTGPERMNVIGLTREDNDKYWVLKESDYTLWKTIEEDVQKCERNRTIRPSINAIGACLYDGEWYRGKVIRVRPIMKVHFIDYGNTEIYKGEIKELPLELRNVEPLAFLIHFGENTPMKYLTKDLDYRKFEVEIINKMENGVRLVRIPEKEPKMNKPKDIYAAPNYTQKLPVILCGFHVNEVLVRPIDENSVRNFEDLQDEINNHVAREARLFVNPPDIGEMVCARCEKNQTYYRARVISVDDGDFVRVNFVDYAKEQETLLKHLKPISEELKKRPDFVIRLTLAGVPNHPPPPQVINYYNSLISSKTKLIMSFEDGREGEGVVLDEEATGIVINDHVFRMIFDHLKQNEMLLENSLKFINLNCGDIKKLLISFIDREQFNKSTIFYVADPQNEQYDYVNEILAAEISKHCNRESIGFIPEVKELCLAKFEGEWYRGINLESINDTQFRIFFIDYGNESVVHKSDIRRMPKDFSEPPCLAIRATIADSKKLINNEKLNDDIFDYLESNVNKIIAFVEVYDVIEDGLTSLTTLRFPEIDRALSNI